MSSSASTAVMDCRPCARAAARPTPRSSSASADPAPDCAARAPAQLAAGTEAREFAVCRGGPVRLAAQLRSPAARFAGQVDSAARPPGPRRPCEQPTSSVLARRKYLSQVEGSLLVRTEVTWMTESWYSSGGETQCC